MATQQAGAAEGGAEALAGDAAAEAPGVAREAVQPPPAPQTYLQQRPPPSPFESVALHLPTRLPGGSSGAEAVPAEVNDAARGSPKDMQPAKSALKISKADSIDAQQSKNMKQAMSWADTHGKAINHVHEYQPSEHGSENLSFKKGCQCCVQ